MIKSLELINFKSFKNSQLIFNNKMNVIVGPNGSGKSNIIDAISFVLGISSLRSIRAEKLDDLIKFGEKSAKVKVILEVGEKEYTIERTIEKKRDGFASTYLLNGKKTTRSNILNLLSNIGVPSNSHNIIMQGDITKLIKMSPNQRRQIIEEISGIKEYEDKKNRALQELDKVNEKLNEARIIYGEKKAKLKELEKEKREAEEFLKLKKLEKDLKGTKYKLLNDKYEKELLLLESKKGELINEIEKIEKELDNYENKVKEVDQKLAEINKEIQKRGESEILEVKKKKEALKLQIHFLNEKKTKIEKEIESINLEINRLLMDKETKENEYNRKNLEFEKIEKELNNLSTELSDLKRKIDQMSNEDILKEYNSLLNKLEKLNKEVDEIRNNKKRERLNLLIGLIEEKRRELREIENTEFSLDSDLEELEDIEEQIEILDRKIIKINSQINDLKRKLSHLIEKEMYLKSKVGRGNYDVINNLKKEFNGVFGTVEELIEYDEEYSLAVEASLGGRMNFLIVDSKNTAVEIINYLRNNKLGRLTIIPLDSVLYRDQKNVEGTLGLLVKYVKYDSILDPAMKSLFDNTYLIRNIEDAKRINERVRLVTLQGDIVETTGYFTGGHLERKKSFYREFLKVSKERNDIEREISELETMKENYLKRQKLLNEEKAEILAKKHHLEMKMKELETKKKTLLDEIEKMDKEIKSLETEIKDQKTREKEIEKTIKELNEKKEKLQKELEKTKEVKLLKEKYENKRLLFENLKQKKAELEAHIKYLNKEINKIKQDLSNMKIKKEKLIEELKTLDPEKLEKEIEYLKKKEKELNEKLGELGLKRTKLEKERENLVFKIIELKNKKDKINNEINDYEKVIIKVKTNLENLKENFIDEEFEFLNLALDEINEKIIEVENKLKMFQYVNTKAIEMYDEFKKKVLEIQEKINNLEDEKKSVLNMIDEIEKMKLEAFINTFDILNKKFGEYYKMFYPEGDAEAYIELQDLTNPLESGILLVAKPPYKTPKNIDSLSGGEKTITALSFIFATQSFKPSLFYILDEPEAALDRENTERMAKMIKKHSEKVQIIVISHNPITIKYGDQIIGVYLDKKGSSIVTLNVKNIINKKQEV